MLPDYNSTQSINKKWQKCIKVLLEHCRTVWHYREWQYIHSSVSCLEMQPLPSLSAHNSCPSLPLSLSSISYYLLSFSLHFSLKFVTKTHTQIQFSPSRFHAVFTGFSLSRENLIWDCEEAMACWMLILILSDCGSARNARHGLTRYPQHYDW